ncbi:MAG TPA: hypothetical protein VJH03_01715 [Blastocatellia bacterium]|nr:hypothetical protein [Blastocatellia bacterium]
MSNEAEILAIVRAIEERLKKLETTVDERLYDTRPLWSDLQPRISGIEARLEAVEKTLHDVLYQLRVLNNTLLRMQGESERLEDRVAALEPKSV